MLGFKVHLGGLWKVQGSNDGKPEKVRKADMAAFEETMDNFMHEALDHIRMLLNDAAQGMAQKIQSYIINQTGAMQWAPLSEDYAAWKERNDLDDRTLIAYGNYVNNIIALPPRDRLGRFTSFKTAKASQVPDMRIQVGLPYMLRTKSEDDGSPDPESPTLRQLGIWLEYGTANMPARPHFGPATFMFKTRELPSIIDQVERFMNQIGKSAVSKRQTKPPRPDKDSPKMDPLVRPDRDVRPDTDVIMPPAED